MTKISVGGCVIKNDKILLIKKNLKSKNNEEIYFLPNGTINTNKEENLESAIIRVILMETNIIAKPRGIVGVRELTKEEGESEYYFIFLLDWLSGEPKLPKNRDYSGINFFETDELNNLSLNDLSKSVINSIISVSFSLIKMNEFCPNDLQSYKNYKLYL